MAVAAPGTATALRSPSAVVPSSTACVPRWRQASSTGGWPEAVPVPEARGPGCQASIAAGAWPPWKRARSSRPGLAGDTSCHGLVLRKPLKAHISAKLPPIKPTQKCQVFQTSR